MACSTNCKYENREACSHNKNLNTPCQCACHTDYPETLYVVKKQVGYIRGIEQLVGSGYLQSMVDEGKETQIAVYRLVGVETYKKTVVRVETVEKVPVPNS